MLSKNQIKEIQSLHTRKFRDKQHLFIVEGVKAVTEVILTKPVVIVQLFGTNVFFNAYSTTLNKAGVKFTQIEEDELKKISLQTNPNQVIALCRYFDTTDDHFDFGTNFSFYLDDIRDPGNFGTIIRLADWFGISTVYCSENSCDFYNPKVIQSSMGSFLRVQIIYITLAELIKEKKVESVYGALLNGNNLYNEHLVNGLIVIGNEANGIREENLKYINKPIKIPAHKSTVTESLNAAMASSIIASEFFRKLRG